MSDSTLKICNVSHQHSLARQAQTIIYIVLSLCFIILCCFWR